MPLEQTVQQIIPEQPDIQGLLDAEAQRALWGNLEMWVLKDIRAFQV